MKDFVSGIYMGKVFHARHHPKVHKFDYHISMFFLALHEVEDIANEINAFHHNQRGWIEFRDSDYLDAAKIPVLNKLALPENISLRDRALALMSHLHGDTLDGEVFLLSHLRCMGMYFSPVNFYYLKSPEGEYSHLLAEVSNTPWNERHCYLVDLRKQLDCQKVFHVSPYNPLDMTYRWKIGQPSEKLNLALECHQEEKHFTAGISLQRLALSNSNVKKVLRQIPNMTLKTVLGIYWQALKLLLKRLPIYDHPKTTVR